MNEEIEKCMKMAWKIKPISRRRVLARLEVTTNGAAPWACRRYHTYACSRWQELRATRGTLTTSLLCAPSQGKVVLGDDGQMLFLLSGVVSRSLLVGQERVGVEQPRRVKHEADGVRDAGTSNVFSFGCRMLAALSWKLEGCVGLLGYCCSAKDGKIRERSEECCWESCSLL